MNVTDRIGAIHLLKLVDICRPRMLGLQFLENTNNIGCVGQRTPLLHQEVPHRLSWAADLQNGRAPEEGLS